MKKGYIALITMIILLFVIILMGVVYSYVSIAKIKSTKEANLSLREINNLDSCVEESLLKLNVAALLPSEININDEISCTIEIEDINGNEYNYVVSSSNNKVRIKAERTDSVYVLKWEIF